MTRTKKEGKKTTRTEEDVFGWLEEPIIRVEPRLGVESKDPGNKRPRQTILVTHHAVSVSDREA